jgi:hypothetical protein
MRLFEKRKADSTSSGPYHPSSPKSDRSPRNAAFPPNRSYSTEAARQEKSAGSPSQVHKWDIGKDPHQIVAETVYLENLSPEKTAARHDHRTSGSGTDGSHGSDENWISGGEIYFHPKNIPSSAL